MKNTKRKGMNDARVPDFPSNAFKIDFSLWRVYRAIKDAKDKDNCRKCALLPIDQKEEIACFSRYVYDLLLL